MTAKKQDHEKIIRMPHGVKQNNGKIKIAVEFEAELFEYIRMNALKKGINFGASVNDVVKCGKLCLTESDALELVN